MAKGEGVAAPMCKNCGEAHWRRPGQVCPKFQRQGIREIRQPERLRLPAPSKADAPPAAKPKAKKRKKAKRAKKSAIPAPAAP